MKKKTDILDQLNKPTGMFAMSGSPDLHKSINQFTGAVTGNYWTQTGMPWASADGRKAVLTEWFWQPIRGFRNMAH